MSAPASTPAFYSARQVADVTGLHYQTVINRINDGTIPSTKFGRAYRVPARWVEENRSGQAQPALHIVPDPVPPVAPDYGPLADVLDILGQALVAAASSLRRAG